MKFIILSIILSISSLSISSASLYVLKHKEDILLPAKLEQEILTDNIGGTVYAKVLKDFKIGNDSFKK